MKPVFPITGTFIDEVTYDIPSLNWTDKQWAKDLDNMKKFGIDTVILIRGGFYDRTNYPSKIFQTYRKEEDDFAGNILREAAKRDINVYVGMFISDLTWGDGDAAKELERNKLFVKETMERYGDITSFRGWYIPHETGNDVFNICDVLKDLSALCKDTTPDKPVLISPFFYSKRMVKGGYLSPEQYGDEWDKIFGKCGKDIDYCAIQDSTAPFELMPAYFAEAKRACDAHGIKLWQNAELIDRYVTSTFYATPFEILKRRLEVIKPYVEKVICFEYSHFMSPQSMFISARNLGKRYYDYYKKNKF